MHTPQVPLSPQARLDALASAGAAALDPLGWHHAQALAQRCPHPHTAVQARLLARLDQLLDDLTQRVQTAPAEAAAPAQAAASPLAHLLHDLAAAMPGAAGPQHSARMQQLRQQLLQMSVQRQVRQALAQAPQNAGPINSHMLVLRALGLMRDIAPAYLQRFMGQLDTLLSLQHAEKSAPVPRKSASRGKR